MISYRTNIHEINNQAILLLGTHLRDMKEEMYMKLFVGVLWYLHTQDLKNYLLSSASATSHYRTSSLTVTIGSQVINRKTKSFCFTKSWNVKWYPFLIQLQ